MVIEAGLASKIAVASSGTAAWHVGKPPDERATQAAASRGYALEHFRAQQIKPEDFARNQYILVMDRSNLMHLEALAPEDHVARVRLFLEFSTSAAVTQVPDPYYGGDDGFDEVLDLIEDGARGLLDHIKKQHMEAV